MPTKTTEREPAYRRIQRLVQTQIENGEFKPGDLLSSERELARQHGVSLMTARGALSALQQQGLVERRRGAGTFVAIPKIDYNRLLSTTELMGARGVGVRSRVIAASLVRDQSDIAARLGLPGEAPLVKLERLRQIEREALAVETSYFSADKYQGLLTEALDGGSLFRTLEGRYNAQIAYSDEEVDATACEARTATLLGIEKGAPLLRIRQTIYTTTGQPLLYVLGLYRSDMHKMHVRRLRR